MKRFVLAAALALVATSAFAADMPVKARPNILAGYPYQGSGFYFGVDTSVGVQQTKVDGTFVGGLASGNLNATGGKIGGTIGWLHGFGDKWIAIEGTLDYQNITASAPGTTISVLSRWSANQVVKFGGFQQYLADLTALGGFSLPVLPNLPLVPSGFVTGTAHPYVMVGVEEFGLQESNMGASGKTVGIAPLVGIGTVDQLIGSNGKPTGAALDLYAKVVFANKGKTIDFDTNPPTFAASAQAGRQYWAGIKLLY